MVIYFIMSFLVASTEALPTRSLACETAISFFVEESFVLPDLGNAPRIYVAYLNSARSTDTAVPSIQEFRKWLPEDQGHQVVQWRRDFELADFPKQSAGSSVIWFAGHGLSGETMGGESNLTRFSVDFFRRPDVRAAIENKFVVLDICRGGNCRLSSSSKAYNPRSLMYSAIVDAHARAVLGVNGDSLSQVDEVLIHSILTSKRSIISGPGTTEEFRYLSDLLNAFNAQPKDARAFTLLLGNKK